MEHFLGNDMQAVVSNGRVYVCVLIIHTHCQTLRQQMEVSRTEPKSFSIGISWCVSVQTASLLDGAEALRDIVSYLQYPCMWLRNGLW